MDPSSLLSFLNLLTKISYYLVFLSPLFVVSYLAKKYNLQRFSFIKFLTSEYEKPILIEKCETANSGDKRKGSAKDVIYCSFGLITFYVLWGFMQEKIMTEKYGRKLDNERVGEMFKDVQFLVFVNRICPFIAGSLYTLIRWRSREGDCQVYKYSISSFCNIVSSFSQYESLKYVIFPLQVLAKSCKVIPTMIVGQLMQTNSYSTKQYIEALLFVLGMVIYLMNTNVTSRKASSGEIGGFVLLILYLTFDSFNSNWQKRIFDSHHVSSLQMMAGVNFFSLILTLLQMTATMEIRDSVNFVLHHEYIARDICILAVSGLGGQFFIFHTIKKLGPRSFSMITTARQVISILLSCFLFNHPINVLSGVGIVIVFGTLFWSSLRKNK